MSLNNKSFWAKITGLSEEDLETEIWEDAQTERDGVLREKNFNIKDLTKTLNRVFQKDKIKQFLNIVRKEKEERNSFLEKTPPESWIGKTEGQLAIDVYQADDKIIIKSAIAGVKQEDLDITINKDLVTIRGERKHKEKIDDKNYFYQECYWGKFSRSVILPCEIKKDKAKANLKDGVLTIVLPKAESAEVMKVKVRENK